MIARDIPRRADLQRLTSKLPPAAVRIATQTTEARATQAILVESFFGRIKAGRRSTGSSFTDRDHRYARAGLAERRRSPRILHRSRPGRTQRRTAELVLDEYSAPMFASTARFRRKPTLWRLTEERLA